jgi:putative ABC transport system permease protein
MNRNLTLHHMLYREIQRSKWNTLSCFAVVLLATGLLVVMIAIGRSSVDETRVLMKEMGFNVLITPPGADPAQYQALNFEGPDMPEDAVEKLTTETVLAQHFVGKYQKTLEIEGKTVVLTGVKAELLRQNTSRAPMPTAYEVQPDKVFAGAAAAKVLNLKPGDKLDILGKTFEVARVIEPKGAVPDDIRLFAPLDQVQELLNVGDRINAIDALACQCPVKTTDILSSLEKSIHRILPGVGVHPYRDILLARFEQRNMVYRLGLATVAIVIAGSATAIWGLTYQNVRNRRAEIGVFRALGIPGRLIIALFISKIAIYGIAGAVTGCVLGYLVAPAAVVTEHIVLPDIASLVLILAIAPVVAILFGLPPIVAGLLQDPVDVLKEATT